MVKLTRIYTRTGDAGETALGNGARIEKSALRIAAIGGIDEANAAIGLAVRAAADDMAAALTRIQNDLFDLGADICVPQGDNPDDSALRIVEAQVLRLEAEIDAMNAKLAPLKSFVLPGGSELSARLHLARAIVRRAERRLVALAEGEAVNPQALRYTNRLSDHLFVCARIANLKDGDVLWRPGAER